MGVKRGLSGELLAGLLESIPSDGPCSLARCLRRGIHEQRVTLLHLPGPADSNKTTLQQCSSARLSRRK